MQPPQDPYHVPATFTFPVTTAGPAVAAPTRQPSPLAQPVYPPHTAYPTDPRLRPLSPYPQPAVAVQYLTPTAAPGPVPASPWTWSGNFPFREVPTPYLPAVHPHTGSTQPCATSVAPRHSEDTARWLAYRRQEEAAVLAAAGGQ
ncbi:hypothetical protein CYMTET_56370 [Cymbomonas tetramitiformis]|uniref:Uncharacterized protein n=1 Tax=Cymbomonas tetramitiformis TaxID=36881 RepID=A0AAE0BB29_9CHLO|nr:hypothetical protein CYMTET_56370 [Cymbomonas tetramitiformis]